MGSQNTSGIKSRERLIEDAILKLLGAITVDGLVIDTSSISLATEATLAIIQNAVDMIEDSVTFDNTAGNVKTCVYYTGVEAGNPSGTTSNIKTITYSGTLNLTKTLTYDASDNILTITVS